MISRPKMQQGQLLRLHLEAMGRLGDAMAHQDGRLVFVSNGIPGEDVVAEVIREQRHYTSAKAVEIVHPSPHRIEPPCAYFGPCTGCQWQHISYEYQLELKRAIVIDALSRVGRFSNPEVLPTMAAPEPYGYRNNARFTIGPGGTLGFVNRQTLRFVKIDSCLIMHQWINEALQKLQGHCWETTQLSIRYGVNTGSWLVQPTLHNPEILMNSGQKHYGEQINGSTFQVSASSFFQVNTHQAEQLAALVVKHLELTGIELVVDAYAGVGTFAILASHLARKVIAIEESSSAVQDARAGLDDIHNVELLQARTEEGLAQLDESPHAVILDPPRSGCHIRTLEALNHLKPQRIVYVSCDPQTQARDLQILCSGPFQLKSVHPVDMFPQTHHVESLAVLTLDQQSQELTHYHHDASRSS